MFEFWHSISYYNFVQECPGKDSTARPSPEAFVAGLKGFATVLADLNPRLVLVYSHSTWDALNLGTARVTVPPDIARYQIPQCIANDGTLMAALPHPSSLQFGNARRWRPAVSKLLIQAGGKPAQIQ